MPFEQSRLDKSVNGRTGTFDKYFYRSASDTINEIRANGYFSASRFLRTERESWIGGIIEVIGSDGYALLQVDDDGTTVTDIGGGTGFVLGSEQNVFDGANRAAAEAARDAYATANESWLAGYDGDSSLNIILTYTDGTALAAQYQVRRGGEWRDNESVRAIRGTDGMGGGVQPFESVTARDAFFNQPANLTLLATGLPIAVNIGDNTIALQVWTGANNPSSYDSFFWEAGSELISSRSLNLGPATRVSALGGLVALYDRQQDITRVPVFTRLDDADAHPTAEEFGDIVDLFDSRSTATETGPSQSIYEANFQFKRVGAPGPFPAIDGPATFESSGIIYGDPPNQLRARVWLGNDNSGQLLIDQTFIPPGTGFHPVDLGNTIDIIPDQEYFVRLEGDVAFSLMGESVNGVFLYGTLVRGRYITETRLARHDELPGEQSFSDITGTLPQIRVENLVRDLADKAASPHDTTEGNFPKYGDDNGNLGAGAGFVGEGGTVVTLNEAGKIDNLITEDTFPQLERVLRSASLSVASDNAADYLNKVFVFRGGTDNTFTLDAASSLGPSDGSNDIVLVNLQPTDLTFALTSGNAHSYFGASGEDIKIPQYHFLWIQNQVSGLYVRRFGVMPTGPVFAELAIRSFTIANSVAAGTAISGSQTLSLFIHNAASVRLTSLDIVLRYTIGGVVTTDAVDLDTTTLSEGLNTISFAIPTARTLAAADDELRISLNLVATSGPFTYMDDSTYTVTARASDHPSQARVKYGWWKDSSVEFGAVTSTNVSTYDGSNVETLGPVELSSIPASLTVPGVDVSGKHFVIEVPADLGTIDTIIENANTALENTVYHSDAPLSTSADFNSITYTQVIGGQTKSFVLIYTRLAKVEQYEGQVLQIHKET